MASHVLPFEKPVVELLNRVRELRAQAGEEREIVPELERLEDKARHLARELFSNLTAWQKVQLSRHPSRPYTLDYIERIFTEFQELHGDRAFADDESIIGGFAKFRGKSVMVIGHQKGRGAKENVRRNFGMPHPEGYRKAKRLFELADRFSLPILTFIDTAGAYPGIGAEERGQSEAIGSCLYTMSASHVPIIATIIGEGGSGGALALGVANRVHVLEYGTYSVITPEGCASILYRDGAMAETAAASLRMTARELLNLGVVDFIIGEPPGGAHQDFDAAAKSVESALADGLGALAHLGPTELREHRYRRFRSLGAVIGD